jgi:hypothetical protein
MSDQRHDPVRDLVQRAHETDPERSDFDVAAGLADVLTRANRSGRPVTEPDRERGRHSVPEDEQSDLYARASHTADDPIVDRGQVGNSESNGDITQGGRDECEPDVDAESLGNPRASQIRNGSRLLIPAAVIASFVSCGALFWATFSDDQWAAPILGLTVGILLGLVISTVVAVRYVRQEMVARVEPSIDLMQMRLANMQSSVHLALAAWHAEMHSRHGSDERPDPGGRDNTIDRADAQ